MRIEWTLEVERNGLLFGAYEVAAEFDRYQGPPISVFIEGVSFTRGAVGKTIHREWVEASGHPYLSGISTAVLEYLATPDGKQRIDDGWAEDEGQLAAERAEYRRSKGRAYA